MHLFDAVPIILMEKQTVVISLGGSLVSTKEGIDSGFLEDFRDLLLSYTGQRRFVVVAGGGRVAREYVKAASNSGKPDDDEKDWIGIYATWLNAALVRAAFGNKAHQKVASDPTEKIDFRRDVLVAGGWKPGFSTDYDAVLWAARFGADTVINASDIDYVYDRDPGKFRDAKPQENLSWDRLLSITGTKWIPSSRLPFDPVAAKKAKEKGVRAAVLNGRDLGNLGKCIEGKGFNGTSIS